MPLDRKKVETPRITRDSVIDIINSDSEQLPLLVQEAPKTQSTTWRIVAFGANSTMISIHMIGVGLVLDSFGSDGQAAVTLVSTLQSLINGTVFGVLMSTGIELGAALGGKNFKKYRLPIILLEENISIETLLEISQAHQNAPVLVKRANRYAIYGTTDNGSTWNFTELNPQLFQKIEILKVVSCIDSGPTLSAILKEIKEKEAHNFPAPIKLQVAGSVIKTSWLVGSVINLLAAGAYVGTRGYARYFVTAPVAQVVSDYFTTFAIGGFGETMGGNSGIIIAQVEKNIWLGLLITAAYRGPALGLGYYFAVNLGLEATGLGYGTAVAGVTTVLLTQFLFSRKPYKDCALYNCQIPNFKEYLNSFLNGGWKLALQRTTEWGNLSATAVSISAIDGIALRCLNPAIQANLFVGLSLQGIGQAAMMFLVHDIEAQKKCYEEFSETFSRTKLDEFYNSIQRNRSTFYKNNLTGFIVAAIMGGVSYALRKKIIGVFLGTDLSENEQNLSEAFFLWMTICYVIDSLRIVSGGILRGWGDLLYPTLVSLGIMTVVGVPAGVGLSYLNNQQTISFFYVRAATIVLATMFNWYRFFGHLHSDTNLYARGVRQFDLDNALLDWGASTEDALLPVVAKTIRKETPALVRQLAMSLEETVQDTVHFIQQMKIDDNEVVNQLLVVIQEQFGVLVVESNSERLSTSGNISNSVEYNRTTKVARLISTPSTSLREENPALFFWGSPRSPETANTRTQIPFAI